MGKIYSLSANLVFEGNMFTGIVEAIGTFESMQGYRISVRTPWDSSSILIGQSIAVQGCCLTVVGVSEKIISFDVTDETLNKTNFLKYKLNQFLNLERAMEIGKRVDGHWVTGHIDTTAWVKKIIPIEDGSSTIFEIGGLKDRMFNLIPKGSIAIDGVSLTVNELTSDGFKVCIIPYTMNHTIFSKLKENDRVNIEFDMIGKFFIRYMENYKQYVGSHADKN